MSNNTSITEFLLLAFADTRELQLLTFWLFLGIYLAALLGNGLIITAIACNHHLHTPMYFFLLNLSLLDLGSISFPSTLPKAMANSLWDIRAISYAGCAAQVFLFAFFITAEYYLLTVMAYDRYVAICKPLHYGTLLGSRACVHMAAAAWGSGFLNAVLHTANSFSLPLCQGNALDQFFCEIPQILKLSCSFVYLREVGLIVVSLLVAFGCFVFIVVSYVQIFRAVLRIPSEQGHHKAFSTCLPHLAVVSLFLSTAVFAYLKPLSTSFPSLDLVVAVVYSSLLYSVVPPALNPLIYSLRNKEIKDALKKLMLPVIVQQQFGAHLFSKETFLQFCGWTLVGAGRVCREEQGLCPLAAEESALPCSSGFMGTVGAGDSAGLGLCLMKPVLTQKGLSASALPVLRNHDVLITSEPPAPEEGEHPPCLGTQALVMRDNLPHKQKRPMADFFKEGNEAEEDPESRRPSGPQGERKILLGSPWELQKCQEVMKKEVPIKGECSELSTGIQKNNVSSSKVKPPDGCGQSHDQKLHPEESSSPRDLVKRIQEQRKNWA
ncbi:olfactory receptor 14A16-like [Phoenicopterus ruber ruber]